MTDLSMELTMLLWASILYVAQIAAAAVAADVQNGVAWGLGNRDVIPVVPGWGGRAKRAHVNMAESLLPFACLVLIAYSSTAGRRRRACCSLINTLLNSYLPYVRVI